MFHSDPLPLQCSGKMIKDGDGMSASLPSWIVLWQAGRKEADLRSHGKLVALQGLGLVVLGLH